MKNSNEKANPEEGFPQESPNLEMEDSPGIDANEIPVVPTELDPIQEARVQALAKTRARRSLDLKSRQAKTVTQTAQESPGTPGGETVNPSPEPEVPITKVGWVDVPGEFLLEWTANPWRARPKRLAVLTMFYLLLYSTVWLLDLQDSVLVIVVPILLIGNASSHLLPSKYIITEEGIYWKNYLNMMFKDWLAIEGIVFEEEMGELFFDQQSFRNRIQRGIPLYYPDNRPEVESMVRRCHSAKWDQLREEVRQRATNSG